MQNYQLDFSGEQINNAIKYQSNYNYLLNPTFTINQRELTIYSGQCYSVDRWFLGDDLASATQSNSEWIFAISGASSASSRILFEQVVENYNDFASLKVTATIKYSSLVESVSGTTQLSIYDGINETTIDLDSTATSVNITHTVDVSPTTLIYRIKTKSTGTNVSIVPVYCKLEIGENVTVNIPRQPSEELLLCQRYFQKIILEGQAGNFLTTTTIQPLIITANTLRVQPSILPIKYPLIYREGTKYNAISWTLEKMNNKQISLSLTTGDNSQTLNFDSYCFYSLKNGTLGLDAEIYPVTTYTVTANGTTSDIYFNYGKSISSTENSGIVVKYSGTTTSAISTTIGNVSKHVSFYSATGFTSTSTSGKISVSVSSGSVSVTEGSNTCYITLNNANSTVTFTIN